MDICSFCYKEDIIMGKIDMTQIAKPSSELTQNNELQASQPTETKTESAELINNASEQQKDTSEIKQETEEKTTEGTVIVRYVGTSVWKDCTGKLWANTDKTKNILSERQYTKEEYETREDIKFMVKYGEMKVSFVGK